MLVKKILPCSLATLLFFNSLLTAGEEIGENTPVEASIDGHVSVQSRMMDPTKRELMQHQRGQQRLEEELGEKAQDRAPVRRADNCTMGTESQFMLASPHVESPKVVRTAHGFPVNCHWLTSISDNTRSLELEDGSHWEVSVSDSYTLRNWRRDDSLVITPNYSWLSSYNYYITNKTTNSYVKANLYVGPLAHGPYSHWIVDIDYIGGHVYLENQMVWCVNPQDSSMLKDWAVNDHVIFGLYDSWFSPFDHILINVDMDNHLRVKQY